MGILENAIVGKLATMSHHTAIVYGLGLLLPLYRITRADIYVCMSIGSLVRWFVGLSVCLVIFVVALDAYMRTISDVFIGRLAAWRLGRTWWRKR